MIVDQNQLNLNTFFSKVRGLGEQCKDYIQCNAKIQNSMCNGNNECRCQPGYIEVNHSCVSGGYE